MHINRCLILFGFLVIVVIACCQAQYQVMKNFKGISYLLIIKNKRRILLSILYISYIQGTTTRAAKIKGQLANGTLLSNSKGKSKSDDESKTGGKSKSKGGKQVAPAAAVDNDNDDDDDNPDDDNDNDDGNDDTGKKNSNSKNTKSNSKSTSNQVKYINRYFKVFYSS